MQVAMARERVVMGRQLVAMVQRRVVMGLAQVLMPRQVREAVAVT